MGGLKFQIFNLNFASVTSGTFATGLREIYFAKFQNQVTEDEGLLKVNHNGSTTVNGDVSITGVTSSDTGTLLVIGR